MKGIARLPRLPRPDVGRRRYRREKRERGIKLSAVVRVILVDPEIVAIPPWARKNSVLLLPEYPDKVWLWPRDADELMKFDRGEGGHPKLVEVEYRECPVCGRPMIGTDAEGRRFLNESSFTGRQLPCGPECTIASQDGRWRKLKRERTRQRKQWAG